jgi:O-antigen/teichoic acid export membrane protein
MSTRQVAKNSLWYAFELSVGIVTVLVSSIVLSRVFGPERLGYYNYFVWLTYVAGMLSTGGLQSTTLKFITEYLSRGEPGTAYLIYRMAWRIQVALAVIPVMIALPMVWYLVPPENRWMATFLVIGVAPRMIGFIPAQINSATQELYRNFPSTMTSNLLTLGIILLAVKFDWGITGLAISHPIGHFADLIIKLAMTSHHRNLWKSAVAPGAKLDPELRARFRRFAASGVGILLIGVLVWDRSDIFLLRHLNPDMRQISFFSYSFTLVDRLLLLPQVLGGALGLNILAQQALDRKRMAATAVSSCFYLVLIGLPVMLGAAAVSRPLWMIYGEKFAPAVPVFVIMSILSISRVVQGPAWVFLQATDNQGRLLIIGIVSSIINLGLDVLLIPSLGAIGAALGSGSAQWFAAICAWVLVARKFSPDLMPGMFGRVLLSGLVMAAIVVMITLSLPPVPGAILGIAAGVVIYIGMLRLTHALRPEDRGRLESLSGVLPVALRSPVNRLLWHLIPHAPAR